MDLELTKQRTQELRKKYSSKLDSIKIFKEEYGLGMIAAHALNNYEEKVTLLETIINGTVSKQVLRKDSFLVNSEIKDLLMALKDLNNKLIISLDESCREVYNSYLNKEIRFKISSLFNEDNLSSFLVDYSVSRASKKINSDLSSSKRKAYFEAIGNYLKSLLPKISEIMKEEGFELESAFNSNLIPRLVDNTDSFCSDSFKGQFRARELECINLSGNKITDNLYNRLEREQTLNRFEMQRKYLIRFFEQYNITDYKEFKANFEFYASILANPKEQVYAKEISRQNKNWIKKFLEN